MAQCFSRFQQLLATDYKQFWYFDQIHSLIFNNSLHMFHSLMVLLLLGFRISWFCTYFCHYTYGYLEIRCLELLWHFIISQQSIPSIHLWHPCISYMYHLSCLFIIFLSHFKCPFFFFLYLHPCLSPIIYPKNLIIFTIFFKHS